MKTGTKLLQKLKMTDNPVGIPVPEIAQDGGTAEPEACYVADILFGDAPQRYGPRVDGPNVGSLS